MKKNKKPEKRDPASWVQDRLLIIQNLEKEAETILNAVQDAHSALLKDVVTRGTGKELRNHELVSLNYNCPDPRNEYAFCVFFEDVFSEGPEDLEFENNDGCLFCAAPYNRQ